MIDGIDVSRSGGTVGRCRGPARRHNVVELVSTSCRGST